MSTMVQVVFSQFDPDPTLEVGEDSLWRYRGRLIQHTESLRLFKSNLRPSQNGEWRTWWGKSSLKVKVLGPALVVKRLLAQADGEQFLALLDTQQEKLVPIQALRVVGDRLALCLDGVLAALNSECASSLMDSLEEDTEKGSWLYQSWPIPEAKGWEHSC